MSGMLMKAMYVAQYWELEHIDLMESIGFSRGRSTPRAFLHWETMLRAAAHGDGFTI